MAGAAGGVAAGVLPAAGAGAAGVAGLAGGGACATSESDTEKAAAKRKRDFMDTKPEEEAGMQQIVCRMLRCMSKAIFSGRGGF